MKQTFHSFDGQEQACAEVERPERYADLFAAIDGAPAFIPRGGGLSYCLASASEGACSIRADRFDRFLAYDEDSGEVEVEPGVRVGRLVRFLADRARHLPAIPGHPSITVGGCVAFNVHGKTQHNAGNFDAFVRACSVYHPRTGEVSCSREERPDLFDLTVGGLGLTGFITRIRLRTLPLPGTAVRVRRIPAANLADAVERMRSLGGDAEVLYSWNNLNRRGKHFGAGIVYAESFEAGNRPLRWNLTDLAPGPGGGNGPSFHARWSERWICGLYHTIQRIKADEEVLSLADTAFPISGKEIYYRMFGRRGFREYQMLIPPEAWNAASRELQRTLAAARIPVSLGSLKLFSGRGKFLHFEGEGICLALDIPAMREAGPLFERLDAVVIDHGGIANLSKDSRIRAETVRRMFPGYPAFREAIRAFDPEKRVTSALRERIDV